MKYLFSILFSVFITLSLYGQSVDTLLYGNDTTICKILVKSKKNDYKVFIKKNFSVDWNEIYPEYGDFAFSESFRYKSIKLPDTEKRVWAKCYFDGQIQLLEYKYSYYLATPDKIYKLTSNNTINDKSVNRIQKSLFKGQMIAILSDKLDYDYSKLQYNAKSLVLPLIKYHQNYNLPYRDYNDYYPPNFDFVVGITGGIETMRLNLQTEEYILGNTTPVDYIEFCPTINAGIKLNIPKLSKRLYFTGGIELSKHKIDVYRKIDSESIMIYYADIQYDAVSCAFPVNVGFELLNNDMAVVAIQTGLKPFFLISSKAQMKLESEFNNIVNTRFITVNENRLPELFHNFGFKISSPALSNKLSAGIGYSYSLTQPVDEINAITHLNSLTFSILYSF